MCQLRLLGVPTLERDGILLTGRPAQRHRLALLALLALSPGHRMSRERLIACLWPDRDTDGGRNLLKVATYVLRGALGEDALASTGDELRLNTEVVGLDVAEFEAALDDNDPGRAVALYTGPLLDGFFLSDAPEFERWLDRERERLARRYRTALEALADAAASAHDPAAAVEWWKVLAAQDPYDSRVALRLMLALEASGHRAGALQHATIHERLLQEEFGMDVAPEIAELAERLRRQPDAGTPAMTAAPERNAVRDDAGAEVSGAGVTPEAPAAAASPAVPARMSGRGRWWGVGAVVAMLVIAGAVRFLPRAADPERSIVVLPFVNLSPDEENEYFSDGLTEEVIARLSAVPGLRVISRTSAMLYKGSGKSLPQIAAELEVDHILEGSVRQSDGRVRISAQLIDARSDGHLWAETYEDRLQDAFRVQEQIAREVVHALEVRLGARARRLLAKQGTRDPEAYELYQRARFAWNNRTREGHERAIEYYRRAIERDSSYADAFAGLAHVYLTAFQLNLLNLADAEAYDRIKWAAERALALDDESADAHVAFAIALQWQRNWPGAGREFRRAIELNPGNAIARSWYSLLLRGMGRSEEALEEGRRAAELDPFGVVTLHNHGWQCYMARDYDCAVEQYDRSLEITPYPSSARWLGMTRTQMGMAEEGIGALRRAVELAPQRSDIAADLAYALAVAGRTDEARVALRAAKMRPLEPYNIGRAHVALGEPDSAFAWLARANWRWPHRAERTDPALDPVRSDPRFAQLAQRVTREMGMQ